MSRLAFAAWMMLAWDLGRVHQYLTVGDAHTLVGGVLLTGAAFVVAYGAPVVRRRRALRALRPAQKREWFR